MAPRPRKAKARNLPPNLYEANGGTSFMYRHPLTGRFHGLGKNKFQAIEAAKELNARLIPTTDLVAQVLGAVTFADHWQWFLSNIVAKRGYKPKTLEMYTTQGKKLLAALGDRPVEELSVQDFAQLMETHTARVAAQIRQVAVDVMRVAVSRGLCEVNRAEQTLVPIYKRSRKRLTMEQFNALRKAAKPWLRNAMDLALHTLQRRVDIVEFKFADIRDGKLYVVQAKTEKYDSAYIAIEIGPGLEAVLANCRDDLASPYLIHRRPDRLRKTKGPEHWTKVTPEYVTRAFTELRDELGIMADRPASERPTFHEIRALGIKHYRDHGIEPQKLAGHSSVKMTNNYDADHEDIRWVITKSF